MEEKNFDKESLAKNIGENPEDKKRIIKEAEISGIVILFDLTNSTDLKTQRGFPDWINDLDKFKEIVLSTMLQHGGKWNKFLGDAYMFFFHTGKGTVPTAIENKTSDDVLEACVQTIEKFWNFYSIYKDRKRGLGKDKNFREMTCAIDMGDEIINWRQIESDNQDIFDPIGTPVDKCFRISGFAGPGQLLVSEKFFKQLKEENQKRFIKIHIKDDSLKGFKDEKILYYFRPAQEIIDYILHDNSVELVESSKPMIVKAKLKLLQEIKKKYEGDKDELKSS